MKKNVQKVVDGMTVTLHFPKSDTARTGDYSDVTIDVHLNGQHYQAAYGDYYHEKGHDKAEGFTDAIQMLHPNLPLLKFRINDREEY